MTVDEYMAQMQDKLNKFGKMWKGKVKSSPEDYPTTLPSFADWDEQFACWVENLEDA